MGEVRRSEELERPPERRFTVVRGGASGASARGDAWRTGRPLEDPEKTKRWGFVTATPSEFLIHMRGGRVLERSSGQGASCFKWPWDSVAIIPTSINRLQFAADQVTREKVGVEVSGLAVYRIVEPLITFRMLNFSYGERASQKLAEILSEMFVGATRRLVANLGIEEVLTQRKEALAGELMREIAPVVGGVGQAADATDRGWGVVIDTIEVQDVRVLSEAVFAQMQAEFRAELGRRSREAGLAADQAVALREHLDRRERARSAAEVDREEARLEEAARLEGLERERRGLEAERVLLEVRHTNEAEAARLAAEAQAAELARAVARAEGEAATERIRLALRRESGELEITLARAQNEVDNSVSEDRVRLTLATETLPALGAAFAQKFGEVHLTSIGGQGTDPASLVGAALGQVFAAARAVGLEATRSQR